MTKIGNKIGNALRNVIRDHRNDDTTIGQSTYVDLVRTTAEYRAAIV